MTRHRPARGDEIVRMQRERAELLELDRPISKLNLDPVELALVDAANECEHGLFAAPPYASLRAVDIGAPLLQPEMPKDPKAREERRGRTAKALSHDAL